MPGLAGLREIGQDLADNRGELEAVPGAGRGDNDLGKIGQHIEDEMLVWGIGEHAGAQGHGWAVRRRKVARGGLAQWRFVTGVRLPLEIVGVNSLLPMMVKTDLETRYVVLWEAVVAPLRDHEVEHREPLRYEKRRLQGREPAQHLTLRHGEIGEGGDQGGHPGAGRENQPPSLVDAPVGGDAHTVTERFPLDDLLSCPDVGAGGQGTLDVGGDAALREEKAATGLE